MKIAFVAIAAVLVASPAFTEENGWTTTNGVATPVQRPPRELDQLKYWVGKWKCAGRVFASPFGPAFRAINIHSFESVLDGFWYLRREEDAKTAENPTPNKDFEFEGYNPATKKFVAVGYDNGGGSWRDTSDNAWGPFLGTYALNARQFRIRYTPTRVNATEWSAVGETQFDGKWKKTEAFTCRRQ